MLLQGKIKLQEIRKIGQLPRRTDGDALIPPGFSRYQLTGRFADCKLIGYKCNQLLIGFAVDRRGPDSKLQALAMQSRPFILAGLGLHVEIQGQNMLIPTVPAQAITALTNQVG